MKEPQKPVEDRINDNKVILQAELAKQLELLEAIKKDLIQMKEYEVSAQYRSIEKRLEDCLFELKEMEKRP